jgi:MYXO-CTERM domain-containing protein
MTRPLSRSRFPRIRMLWAALPLLLSVPLLQAQSGVAQGPYFDGTFAVDAQGTLTDWSIYGPFVSPQDSPDADVDASAPRSGGDPGAFLRVQLTSASVPRGESWVVWGILINEEAVYDPGSLGAIDKIDFDFDARLPPGERGQRVVSLAVRQDGFLWSAVDRRVFIQGLSWAPISISDLQAADFIALSLWSEPGQPQTPDFSENGLPVSFGLLDGQSCPTTSDCSVPPALVEVDIDNWTVTVNGIDEPMTGGSSGAGGMGAGGMGGVGAAAGIGGSGGIVDEAGGCACRVASKQESSNPWLLPLLALAAFVIRQRLRRS